jgi:predicted porin
MNNANDGSGTSRKRARAKYPARSRLRVQLLTGLLATAPVAVMAQSSLTFYGIIDESINYRTSAGIDPSTGKVSGVLALLSGADYASRWGLRGDEDIGGGLKAIFQLESGFNASTGAGNSSLPFSSVTNALFDRLSYVGLVSPLGTVRLGRNWAPFYDAVVAGDAAPSNFGAMVAAAYANSSNVNPALGPAAAITGTNSRINGGLLYSWVNNSIKYNLPDNFYGLSGGVLYSFGGTAGDVQNKSTWSANLDWTNGTLGLTSGYYNAKDPSGMTDKPWLRAYTLGVSYVIGSLKSGFEFTKFRNPTTGSDQNYYYVAATWYARPDLSFVADFMHLQDLQNSSAGANLYKVGTTYYLSKSTMVYALLGYADNKSQGIQAGGLSTLPLVSPGLAGRNQLATEIGLRKIF